jgi:hypothetical protein
MKKGAIIILICIYSLATVGFTLKQFYCCGNLESITLSFGHDKEKKCNRGEGRSCCNNKYQFFKGVNDNHISADNITLPINYFTDLQLNYLSFVINIFAVKQPALVYNIHSPPLQTEVPLYIYNCVFRI